MSPRAAWQLAAFGFGDVYDYPDGKVDWISHGGDTEGNGPHYAVAGEAAQREEVATCTLHGSPREAAGAPDGTVPEYCVVLNDHGIVLGRVWDKDVVDPNMPVERAMEPGPPTVRATEPAQELLPRMVSQDVDEIIVTTKSGELVGVATQERLHEVLHKEIG